MVVVFFMDELFCIKKYFYSFSTLLPSQLSKMTDREEHNARLWKGKCSKRSVSRVHVSAYRKKKMNMPALFPFKK